MDPRPLPPDGTLALEVNIVVQIDSSEINSSIKTNYLRNGDRRGHIMTNECIIKSFKELINHLMFMN